MPTDVTRGFMAKSSQHNSETPPIPSPSSLIPPLIKQAEEAFQKRLLHASCYTCPQRLLLPILFFLLLLRPLTYFFGWKSRRNSLMMITYSRITPLSSFYALLSVCATASTSYHHILPSMHCSPSTTILYGLTIHQYIKKAFHLSSFYVLLDIIAMK